MGDKWTLHWVFAHFLPFPGAKLGSKFDLISDKIARISYCEHQKYFIMDEKETRGDVAKLYIGSFS